MPSSRTTWLATLVAGAMFMQTIDATMIATAMPAMGHAFGVDAIDLGMGISSYVITLAVLVPASGWLAERLGARRIFMLAVAVFTLASLLCGASRGLGGFVLARILQGAGGAMMVPVGRLVVLKHTPKERLIYAIAALTWPALVGPVLGPVLGGLITVHFGWQWIFWVNLPLGAVAVAAAWALIPVDALDAPPVFDGKGFVLSGVGIVSLMVGVELVSLRVVAWVWVTALLAVGLALLTVLVGHLRRAAHPIIPLDALRTKSFAVTIYGGSLFRMSISAIPYVLPLMFQVGFGYGPVRAGMLVMAVFAGNVAMKPLTTPFMHRFGFRRILIVNGVLNAAVTLACIGFTPLTPDWVVLAVLFASGLTRSMQFTATNTIAFSEIPQPKMSGANTLFSTAFQLSWGTGVVVGAIAIRSSAAALRLLGNASLAATPGLEFRLAFVVLAFLNLVGIADFAGLEARAGDAVARRRG